MNNAYVPPVRHIQGDSATLILHLSHTHRWTVLLHRAGRLLHYLSCCKTALVVEIPAEEGRQAMTSGHDCHPILLLHEAELLVISGRSDQCLARVFEHV